MQKQYSKLSKLIILIIVTALFSCSVEKRIAKEFIKTRSTVNILVYNNNILSKSNIKINAIQNYDSLSTEAKDSVWMANTVFLNNIKDSVFINNYYVYFVNKLKVLGFKVFTSDSLQQFMSASGDKFIISLIQNEIEEYYDYQRIDYDITETTEPIFKEFWLNALNFNTWLEINKANSIEPLKIIVYSSLKTSDGLDAKFTYQPFTDEINFVQNYYPVTIGDVMSLSVEEGKRNAYYLFDYLMNLYIKDNLGQKPNYYYHYNGSIYNLEHTNDKFAKIE